MGGAIATKGFVQLDMVLKKGTPKELTAEPYEVGNSNSCFFRPKISALMRGP